MVYLCMHAKYNVCRPNEYIAEVDSLLRVNRDCVKNKYTYLFT